MADGTGRLVVIATPIGNLEDLTYRAARMLSEVNSLACEDTRHTKIIYDKYDLPRPATVFSYHEHNEDRAAARILGLLAAGQTVGLASNAGYPGISDPGYVAVSRAIEAGYPIEVIPGASAVPTALIASGLPTSSFTFLGFPPRKSGKRQHFLEADRDRPHTLILYEAPTRVSALLADALIALGDRKAAVCVELTKMFEDTTRGYLSDLIPLFEGKTIKGEVVVVIAGKNKKFVRGEEETKGRRIVEHLRGRGDVPLTTDEIMAMTRGEE
jgi:16S rRNA (cytidine1402-2'-O)-methyltransferase